MPEKIKHCVLGGRPKLGKRLDFTKSHDQIVRKVNEG